MGDEGPLVTVNIVTRNRKDALKRAIASAYGQTYRPIEVVVVDNDSEDGSPEIVEATWPEIRVIRMHRNIGCQPGRNVGMKNSRGKYIFNLDDDGALHPKAIARMVRRFEAEPDVALVAASVQLPGQDQGGGGYHPWQWKEVRYVAGFPGGASAIRRCVLEKAGYFPEYPRGHAEADLALRILHGRYEMVYLPDVIMYHDLSDIERDKNVILYYAIWHRLETAYRLEPWRQCVLKGFWKLGVDFKQGLRERALCGFFRGVFRFLYELPRILAERSPVSVWAVQKSDFLSYNFVVDGARSRRFKQYSMWEKIRARVRSRHRARSSEQAGPGRGPVL